MLKIVQAPNPTLSATAKPVGKIDAEIKKLIQQMKETLEAARDPEGVGLAAPQVGKSLKLFIVKESKESPLQVFINPVIHIPDGQKLPEHKETKDKEVKLEGCLSLQDIWGIVDRYEKVKLSYQDETGKSHTKMIDGFLATIVQHECDHLEGILFPRRVLEQKGQLYKSVTNKKGEIEFEEISL
jgi:peptide deformylase